MQDIPRLEIPLHTLIELVPKPDGKMAETRISIDANKLHCCLQLKVLFDGRPNHRPAWLCSYVLANAGTTCYVLRFETCAVISD